MAILKKKPKGPTYITGETEVTIPFPVKKQDGYYTSMKDVYEDGMKAEAARLKPKVVPTGVDENLINRQQYKESTFNPKAVSPRNARGLAQIMPNVEGDAVKAGVVKQGDNIYDPVVNEKIQKWYMNNLYNSTFINKKDVEQKDSVKLAKVLAAYNWGRGNVSEYLTKQKERGVDIYNSYDWIKDLPKETSDYVNAILLKKNSNFEDNYKRALIKRNKNT